MGKQDFLYLAFFLSSSPLSAFPSAPTPRSLVKRGADWWEEKSGRRRRRCEEEEEERVMKVGTSGDGGREGGCGREKEEEEAEAELNGH